MRHDVPLHQHPVALPPPPLEALPVPVVAWLAALAGAVLLYVMLQENGAVLAQHWEVLHEFFHDGRHVAGVPCH